MQGSTKRMNIISRSGSKVASRHIKAMHEVDKFFFGKSFKEFAVRFADCIPPHVRHLIFVPLRNKTFHIHIKNIQAIHSSFFRITAHQLHTETNSEHRLTQVLYQFVQSCRFQVVHGSFRLSYSGENYFIGRLEFFFIGSNHCFHPQPFQYIIHRTDIAGIVFYDCYFHQLNITVLFL